MPGERLQVTAAGGGELYPLGFQHSLLLVRRQDYASGRAPSLGIDHAMPWGLLFVGAVHDESHRARRVSLAEKVSDLAVGHDPAARNPAYDFVNSFAILEVRLWFVFHVTARS